MSSIQAYASRASVSPGETIDFMVSYDHGGSSSAFTIQFYREGAVGGAAGEVPVGDPIAGLQAELQAIPPDFNENGCRWPVAYQLDVPNDWASGVYIARLTGSTDDITDVLFVVKAAAPGSSSKIVLALTVNTAQAYNAWGGTSLYSTPRALRVSFDRPGGLVDTFRTFGERRFIAWAERNGFELEYCTSIDLHADSALLGHYQLLLSVGHDEYWSKEMRDNVEAFIANGGNVAFFSGNVCWWQVRFENYDRTMVCYKSDEHHTPPDDTPDPVTDPNNPDPIFGYDPSRATVHWSDFPVNRPENSMTGVSFGHGAGWWGPMLPDPNDDRRFRGYTVTRASHWVFYGARRADGTRLANGNEFPEPRAITLDNAIVGNETDAAVIAQGSDPPVVTGEDGTPKNFLVLARANLSDWPGSTPAPPSLSPDDQKHWLNGDYGSFGAATMGIYQRNGTVFTAATINWAGGLSLDGGWTAVDQITRNVLTRLLQRRGGTGWLSLLLDDDA